MICVQLRPPLASRDTFVSSKIVLKVVFLERDFERDHLAEKSNRTKMGHKIHCAMVRFYEVANILFFEVAKILFLGHDLSLLTYNNKLQITKRCLWFIILIYFLRTKKLYILDFLYLEQK
jgi:hypothetical protein